MKINILQKSASSAKELFRSADFDNILRKNIAEDLKQQFIKFN